jgi:hypothetical protein
MGAMSSIKTPPARNHAMPNPCFSSGQVAVQVGLPRWWFLYLLDKGLLPGPSLQVPGRRLFTQEDIQRIGAALERRPELRRSERESSDRLDHSPGATKA